MNYIWAGKIGDTLYLWPDGSWRAEEPPRYGPSGRRVLRVTKVNKEDKTITVNEIEGAMDGERKEGKGIGESS